MHERRLRCAAAEAFDAWLRMGQWWPTDGEDTVMRLEHGGWHAGNAGLRAKLGDWPLILDRYAEHLR